MEQKITIIGDAGIGISNANILTVNSVNYISRVEISKSKNSIFKRPLPPPIPQLEEYFDITKKERRVLSDDIVKDIVNQYTLVENKTSKLSKWERDEVKKVFNDMYVRLENLQQK